ncbi:MAG: ABC transporter ATP-binding protein [Termitinemataceae bacterium]|nr:MAG: ABC transporter ATP-binding protein [Termitinemataceae bacterium]
MYIEIKNISKEFSRKDKNFLVLDNISLNIDKGEFVCILGPSGCGKTMLLNIVAGFIKQSSGNVFIDGTLVNAPSPNHVVIFQDYGLLPWRTVHKNVELGLESKKINNIKIDAAQRKRIADKYIDMVGLSDFADLHPIQLSGGMKQRTAIARALAVNPDIIFMDEPFGALDAFTRTKMQDDILRINLNENKTILFVTHDIEEAIFLSDRIVIMQPAPGRIKEIICVDQVSSRDRTSAEFLATRNKILEIFNDVQRH